MIKIQLRNSMIESVNILQCQQYGGVSAVLSG